MIKDYDFTPRFKKHFVKLSLELQEATRAALEDLKADPIPHSRRFHSISGTNPKVYTIDVLSNKSYKISMEIKGTTAILRRVASHKEIDRSP